MCVGGLPEVHYYIVWAQVFVTLLPNPEREAACVPALFCMHTCMRVCAQGSPGDHICEPSHLLSSPTEAGASPSLVGGSLKVKVTKADVAPRLTGSAKPSGEPHSHPWRLGLGWTPGPGLVSQRKAASQSFQLSVNGSTGWAPKAGNRACPGSTPSPPPRPTHTWFLFFPPHE